MWEIMFFLSCVPCARIVGTGNPILLLIFHDASNSFFTVIIYGARNIFSWNLWHQHSHSFIFWLENFIYKEAGFFRKKINFMAHIRNGKPSYEKDNLLPTA